MGDFAEMILAIALWCQAPYNHGTVVSYAASQASKEQDKCRQRLIDCLNKKPTDRSVCFLNEKIGFGP